MPRRWVVERTSPGSVVAVGCPRIGRKRSPPPSHHNRPHPHDTKQLADTRLHRGEGPGGSAPFAPSSADRPASATPRTFRSVQPVPRAGALTPVPRWSARARDAGGKGSRKEMGKDMAKANATTATSAATSMSASPIASNSSRRAPGQRVRFTRPATPSQRHRLSRHCAIGSRYRSVSSVYCMAYSSASVSS